MAKNSRGATGTARRNHERHTGADGVIKFDFDEDDYLADGDDLDDDVFGSGAGGIIEIPVTNIEWNRDFDTNDVQHNGSLNPTLTTTGVRFEGSFEYTGQQPKLMDMLARHNESAAPRSIRPVRGTLTFNETRNDKPNLGKASDDNHGVKVQKFTFVRVLITSVNRDYPSDDSTTVSCDWEAEDMLHETDDWGGAVDEGTGT